MSFEFAFEFNPSKMLKEHSSFIKQAIALIDCVLLVAAFYIAYSITAIHRNLHPIQLLIMVIGFMGFYLYLPGQDRFSPYCTSTGCEV